MIKKYLLGTLKFFIVDSIVNILGDLFEQTPPMWAFIGWGWVAVLVMIFSMATTVTAVVAPFLAAG
ncbi:MAG: hypothetical protein KUG79_10435 [Pseudomonadales bacterium]|nr:hypothetical protein [Pseudomonadales bacterium]